MCSSDFILIYKYYTSKVSLFSSNRFRVSFFPSKSFLGVTFLSKSFHRWCHFFRQIVSRVSDYIHSIRKIWKSFTQWIEMHTSKNRRKSPYSSCFLKISSVYSAQIQGNFYRLGETLQNSNRLMVSLFFGVIVSA